MVEAHTRMRICDAGAGSPMPPPMRLPQAYDAAAIAARADDAQSWTERYGAPLLAATRARSPGSTGDDHPRCLSNGVCSGSLQWVAELSAYDVERVLSWGTLCGGKLNLIFSG